jgi:polysaccharide pyruvyl transferase WcaK-like protein
VVVYGPPTSGARAARDYRAARLVLAQRFHAGIAAAAAGTRFVTLAHETKLSALAGEFGQASTPPAPHVTDLVDALERAAAGPVPAADEVRDNIERATEMLTLMRALLEGGGPEAAPRLRELRMRPPALIR